ncbi:MAG: demethoxyubiquinone hydroxylase family protein [Comamonas sp.]
MPISARGTRILKVNHAGENGAVHIYSGQIAMARWRAPHRIQELQLFQQHELQHRAIFAAELQRRGARRCYSYGLCGVGGYVLGCITGLLGANAIAATTEAVEHVVLQHLHHQIAELQYNDTAAAQAVERIMQDEQHHHDSAAAHATGSGFWRAVLIPIVAASTQTVIWLGMHL